MRRQSWWLEPLAWSVGLLLVAAALLLPPWLREGPGMRFASPWFLLGLLAVPVVVAAGIFERRTAGRLRISTAQVLFAETRRSWRVHLLPAGVGLRAAAIALLALALARPQDANDRQESETRGIDIVLTLDVSGSMQARDLEPNRLEAAKEVTRDFITRRKNDRIGAVIFAENAFTLCPLTLDYSILSGMIADLTIGVIDDKATAIGNAVGVAINRLRKSDAKSKVIILLTDGSSNAGNISPEQATAFAKTLGIKIYTVLVGEKDVSQVASGFDFFRSQIFSTRSTPVNPELLRKMSTDTGGAFFEATDKGSLVSSFHAILDALERSRIADRGVIWGEVFAQYLWPALFLAALDLLLGLFVLRRTP
jgi:Ca-activated chloride channel homolog